jgi:uncharacterized protein DUF4321
VNKGVDSVVVLLAIVILGGLIGSVLGEVIATALPGGILERLLSRGVSPGLNPPFTLDLKVIVLTVGFAVKITLASLLGIALSLLIWKRL